MEHHHRWDGVVRLERSRNVFQNKAIFVLEKNCIAHPQNPSIDITDVATHTGNLGGGPILKLLFPPILPDDPRTGDVIGVVSLLNLPCSVRDILLDKDFLDAVQALGEYVHRVEMLPLPDDLVALGDFLAQNRVCVLSLRLERLGALDQRADDACAVHLTKMMLLQDKQGFHAINLRGNSMSVFGLCLLVLAASYGSHLYPDLRGGCGVEVGGIVATGLGCGAAAGLLALSQTWVPKILRSLCGCCPESDPCVLKTWAVHCSPLVSCGGSLPPFGSPERDRQYFSFTASSFPGRLHSPVILSVGAGFPRESRFEKGCRKASSAVCRGKAQVGIPP